MIAFTLWDMTNKWQESTFCQKYQSSFHSEYKILGELSALLPHHADHCVKRCFYLISLLVLQQKQQKSSIKAFNKTQPTTQATKMLKWK